MTEDIDQLRTELLNVMAEAGRLALKFDPLSAAAFAPIPSTDPQQYVVAGTLPMIAKVLPAESSTDWRPYHSALSRCAELLDNMKDGDPITEVPDFLAAYLASQSQAAQPSEKQVMAVKRAAECVESYGRDDLAVLLREVAAHLAGQSQATRAVPEAIVDNGGVWPWERRAEAAKAFLRNYADSEMEELLDGYKVQPIIRRLAAAIKEWQQAAPTAQVVTQQAAPEVALWDDNGEPWNEAAEREEKAAAELRQLRNRVSQLEAARIGYASEFAMNADGEPDVGNIHSNIRALKAKLSSVAQQAAKAETAEQAPSAKVIINDGNGTATIMLAPGADLKVGTSLYIAPTTSTVSAPEEDSDESDDACRFCEGQGEVQGYGSALDIDPPIRKCSECDGSGKAGYWRTTSGKGEAA